MLLVCAAAAGCGTTKWSDTSRTATEQLLISDAVDRAVTEIDFTILSGREIYLETKFIDGIVDEKYIIGTMRQHMLASGCIIKDKVDDAQFVVEVRTGAVGTNRNDLLFGVPATNLPTGGMFPLVPSSIPEVPLMKRTNQQGVCKISVFAYDRLSGQPVWQSGNRQVASKAKDIWVFGTGPFQRGTIYDGTKFAGERLAVPLTDEKQPPHRNSGIKVSQEKVFQPPIALRSPQRHPNGPPNHLAGPSSPSTHPAPVNTPAGYAEPVRPQSEFGPAQPARSPYDQLPLPPDYLPSR